MASADSERIRRKWAVYNLTLSSMSPVLYDTFAEAISQVEWLESGAGENPPYYAVEVFTVDPVESTP